MKKKIKNVLLVGFGAEIGSMLLSMNDPKKDNLKIDTVLTRSIPTKNGNTQLESLYARMVLNEPSILPFLKINKKDQSLEIKGRKIKIFWGDIASFNLKKIKRKFNATIVATSNTHINDKKIMKRF